MVPAPQSRLWINRSTVYVDLEMQVAADRDRVAGLPHRADSLSRVDALAPLDQRGSRHVA